MGNKKIYNFIRITQEGRKMLNIIEEQQNGSK